MSDDRKKGRSTSLFSTPCWLSESTPQLLQTDSNVYSRSGALPPLGTNGQSPRRNSMMIYGSTDDILRDPAVPRRRGISMEVDRQVVSHLRRKLNRRLERRLMEMEEAEMLLQDIDTGAKTPLKSPKKLDAPVDIFTNYNDFGEKVPESKSPRKDIEGAAEHQSAGQGSGPKGVAKRTQIPPLKNAKFAGKTSSPAALASERSVSQSSSGQKVVPIPDTILSSKLQPINALGKDDPAAFTAQSNDTNNNSVLLETGKVGRFNSAVSSSVTSEGRKPGIHAPSRDTADGLSTDGAASTRATATESVSSQTDQRASVVEEYLNQQTSTFQLTGVNILSSGDQEDNPSEVNSLILQDATEDGCLSMQEKTELILAGQMNVYMPPDDKHIQIFLHSQYTDTQTERSMLMEKLYPQLKSYFRDRGYSLDVIDLNWGLRAHHFDDHSTVRLSQRLIDECYQNTRCFSFITMLGQRYGEPMLPATVEEGVMNTILAAVEAENLKVVEAAAAAARAAEEAAMKRAAEDAGNKDMATSRSETHVQPLTDATDETGGSSEEPKPDVRSTLSNRMQKTVSRFAAQATTMRRIKRDVSSTEDFPDVHLIRTWYKLDKNADPPVYRLQNISTQYKDVLRNEAAKKLEGYRQWSETVYRLQKLLYQYAQQTLGQNGARLFNTSLLEIELNYGLLNTHHDVNGHCYWFRRDVEDLRDHAHQENVRDYLDLHPRETVLDTTLTEYLDCLLDDQLPNCLSKANIWRYPVNWHPRGISPASTRSHVVYMDHLRKQFNNIVTRRLDDCIKQEADNPQLNNPLYREVVQHVNQCHQRSKTFYGRRELLESVRNYVRRNQPLPLIIHGKLGCGNTSLMAKVAVETYRWLRCRCSVLVRMIGTTVDSVNIRLLLRSLCEQLCRIYDKDPKDVPEDYRGLVNDFSFRISMATADNPLVIILDGLDGLSDEHEARKMGWIPRDLPAHVHLIASTAEDDRFDCFPNLKKAFDKDECFLQVPALSEEEALLMWENWMESERRTVTSEQLTVVMSSFQQCPLPLYLRLVHTEAVNWPSYQHAGDIRLPTAVSKSITALFARLERDHGEPLVRRALGYVTAARHGLTRTELSDLLSLDDVVMDDIMAFAKPQLRRLPPIYWARIRHQLGEFLGEAPTDGLVTLRWAHASFHEACTERYLDQRDKAPSYHKAIAEYFTDMWLEKPKPCNTHPKGVLRHVLAQPLYNEISCPLTGLPTRAYNLRRLAELPYHFLKSQQFDLLKKECLCNFEFVMSKISGLSLRELFEDIQMALLVEPTDKDLALLSHTLHLSDSALRKDPRQLASQVVGRLHQIITKDTPVSPGDPVKYPAMKPFFRGAYKSSQPALIPSMTCLTPPGGILFDFLSGHTEPITSSVTTADGQRAITTSKDGTLKLWDLRTGRVSKTIAGVGEKVLSIRLGLGGRLAITSEQQCIRIWDLSSGLLVRLIDDYEDPASIVTADDGRLLVAFFDGSGTMRVWDMSTEGVEMHKEIDISDDGQQVVHMDHSILVASNSHGPQVLYSYRGSRSAFVRNAKSGTRVRHLEVKTGAISALAISREYFIVAIRLLYMKLHEIYRLELFDIGNGKYIRGIRGCVSCHVTELYVNQIGSHVTSVCSSEANDMSDIAVWNVETEDHKHMCRQSPASTFGACADMRFMLTASRDENTLRIWNLSSKVNQPAPKEKVKEGLEQILNMPDHPRYIMTKSINEGPLSVWNVVKNKYGGLLVRSERGLVDHGDILVTRNTKAVILTERGFSNVSEEAPPVFMTVLVYDIKEKKYMQKITGCYIVPSQAHEYVFLNDEQLMGLSENRNHFVIWSLITGHVIHRIKSNFKYLDEFDDFGMDDNGGRDVPRRRRHQSKRMLPWERRAESRSARDRRHKLEVEDERKRLYELRKEKENVIEQFIISKDLSTIVASYYGHHICVFDVPSLTHIQTLENPASMLLLHVAALTDNGSHLVHANYDDDTKTSYVTLWDCKNGCVKKRIKNERNVCTIALSDRGEKVVFGKTNKELRIWTPGRTNSLKRIKGYAGLNFGVGSKISIIDNGAKAIVFAGDVSVWDLESCTVLAVFTPDMKIQCFTVLMEGALIAFGLRESPDVVTLRLMSRDLPKIAKQGVNIFGEEEDSSNDDDDDEEDEAKPEDDDD